MNDALPPVREIRINPIEPGSGRFVNTVNPTEATARLRAVAL